MRPFERRKEFRRLRQIPIPGESFLLEPYRGSADQEHAMAALAFRAAAANRASEAQRSEGLTLNEQHRWHRGYLDQEDEIVWLLRDYENHLIGSTGLGAIDLAHGSSALLGSTVIDRFADGEKSLATEAIELVLQTAFENFKLRRVCATLKATEREKLARCRSLGFRWAGWAEPDDREEMLLELSVGSFDPDRSRVETRFGAVAS